jgi:hypothetical protein
MGTSCANFVDRTSGGRREEQFLIFSSVCRRGARFSTHTRHVTIHNNLHSSTTAPPIQWKVSSPAEGNILLIAERHAATSRWRQCMDQLTLMNKPTDWRQHNGTVCTTGYQRTTCPLWHAALWSREVCGWLVIFLEPLFIVTGDILILSNEVAWKIWKYVGDVVIQLLLQIRVNYHF